MRATKLTRAQRRSFLRIMRSDANYFARFPHRRHRVRVADRAEIERVELTGGDVSLPPGKQHYTAVRYLSPDAGLCLLVRGPAGADPDLLSEQEAKLIFDLNSTKEFCRVAEEHILRASTARCPSRDGAEGWEPWIDLPDRILH